MNIGILDYGLGNIGSIKNMILNTSNVNILYIQEANQLQKIDKLILPGVGSYDTGVMALKCNGLYDAIRDFATLKKKPILGICLGMQLLGNSSEEGSMMGLGLIDFNVVRFKECGLKIPHMGWNYVENKRDDKLGGIGYNGEDRFYFVHSYHAVCNDINNVWLTSYYGYDFVAAVNKDNIYGVQFHPEKSHKYGKKIIKWFVEEA